jgi:cytoskeleton protein RodZ
MPDSESSAAEPEIASGPSIGSQLRTAREKRGLSLDQLADSLHLDESLVAALENDDFDALGAPVFARGHLKTCARFLQLDADALLVQYAQSNPAEVDGPPPPSTRGRAPFKLSLAPWAMGAIGFAVAAGLVFYLLQDDPESNSAAISRQTLSETDLEQEPVDVSTANEPSSESVALAGAISPAAEPTGPVDPVRPTPEVQEVAPVLAPMPPAAPPEEIAQAARGQKLTLYFRGESWTEISDRNGRLLFGLQREGIRRELTGEPPFKLLLGNADNVDVYLDEAPFDLPAGSMRGKVARFVIESAADQASQ